jgi:predicted proteasome-type protease
MAAPAAASASAFAMTRFEIPGNEVLLFVSKKHNLAATQSLVGRREDVVAC